MRFCSPNSHWSQGIVGGTLKIRHLFTFEFLIDEHARLLIPKKKLHLGIFIRDFTFIYFDKEKFWQGKTLHLNASNESEIVIFRKYFTLI